MVSLLEPGRLRLSSTSTTGSMASRLRLSQPFLILTLARARRFCSVRVIYRNNVSMAALGATAIATHLRDLCPPQHFAGDLVLFGHGGECVAGGCTAETEVGVLGGCLTAAVADGETPYGPGAEVTTARNVRSGWKRLARRCGRTGPSVAGLGTKAS
jgi:hypothetical protein